MRTLLALTAAALLASPAAAQRYLYVGQTEIGHFGGRLAVADVVTDDQPTALAFSVAYPAPLIYRLSVRTATELGLRVTRHNSHRISTEIHWSYGFSELVRTGPVGDRVDEVTFDRLGIVQFGAALIFHPLWAWDERVGPFVRVGVGAFAWRPADDFPDRLRPLHTRRTASFAGTVGAGVVFYATEDLSLRAEYQFTRSRLDRDRLLGLDFPFPKVGSRDIDAHRVSIGISLRFFDTTL